jgi:hypothetical protein
VARVTLIQEGEECQDLSVIEMCPDREEQPKEGCEECSELAT